MSRTISAVVFAVILALGLVMAFGRTQSVGEIGAPPEALIQFDEETTAQFSEDAATRRNRDQVIIVLSITLGVTGMIVVSLGGSRESSG